MGKRDAYVDDLFEPFSPVNSPDHLFDLSDEEGKRVSHDTHTHTQTILSTYTHTSITPVCTCMFICLPIQSNTAAMGYPVEELSDEVS